MRKITLVLTLFTLFLASKVKADQLAWITEAQAKKAVNYLKKNKKVILFCACCAGHTKQKVEIQSITYRHPKMNGRVHDEYYQVYITVVIDGKQQEIGLDLAYVHVKKKNKAKCLGKVLGFHCNPCTKPFSWKI